jgi:negative regulator of flagellin synthesis FlgM
MKIESNSPSASLLPADRSTKQISTTGTAIARGVTQDRTTLHTDSQSVQSLTSQAMSSPEVRQDKVDEFRQSVNSGTYELDATKIASAIISGNGE